MTDFPIGWETMSDPDKVVITGRHRGLRATRTLTRSQIAESYLQYDHLIDLNKSEIRKELEAVHAARSSGR